MASISSLFFFNPTLQPQSAKPTDEEYTLCKLLYYYPEGAPLYEQQSHVGLAEGLMLFVGQFSQEQLETIRTERHSHVLLQCEPNIWLCLILHHPPEPNIVREADQMYSDDVLQRLARRYYLHFYLFHGALSAFSVPTDLPSLRRVLTDFTQVFLLEFMEEGADFEGFYYCPLDKKAFLLVQFLLNQVTTQRESVLHTLVFFDGYFVSSSLPHEATLTLYSYCCRDRNWQRLPRLKRGVDSALCTYGRLPGYPKQGYVYGLNDGQTVTPIVQFAGNEQQFRLVLWADQGLQLVLLLSPEEYAADWLQDLGEVLLPQAEAIRNAIKPQLQRHLQQEDNFRFIYFNKMNFALKKSARLGELDAATLVSLGNIAAKFNERAEYADGLVRSVVKTQSHWVFAVNSLDARQIFVLFPNSGQAAIKVEEEALRFINYYFSNVFLGL